MMQDGTGSAREETPLDVARAAQLAARPGDLRAEQAFYERVLDAELVLALAPGGEDDLAPEVFPVGDERYALAFDRDERLAAFFGAPVHFAAASGRQMVTLLAGRGIGLGLNLGAPSETLLPPEAIDWLATMAQTAPQMAEARVDAVAAPGELAPGLLAALGPKVAAMADVITGAWLVRAAVGEPETRLLLVLMGVPLPAQTGVAAAVAEALAFSVGGSDVDVIFLGPESPLAEAVRRTDTALALPTRPAPAAGPGLDPARPPRLR